MSEEPDEPKLHHCYICGGLLFISFRCKLICSRCGYPNLVCGDV
jgi:hypothetical protein